MKSPVKKLVLLGLIFIVMLVSAAPVFGAPQKARVFVQFAPGGKSNVQTAIRAAGGEFHYTFDDLDSFVVSLPAQALDGLARNPNVVRIVEDSLRDLIASTPSLEVLAPLADTIGPNGQIIPWGVDAVQARDVWDSDSDGSFDEGAPTGSGITVCIIDTGFYSAHEDLAGVELVGGTTQVSTPYYTDGFGHGSHVAGTIAAQNNDLGVVGVSPGVSFYIIKYFNDDGTAQFTSDLISGSNACVSNGARIISMSLGGPTYNFIENWHFSNLYNSGVLLVAAAGNAGDTSLAYPASYNSVISVAAINEAETVASFSQQNNQVELAAPGVGVMSTLPYVDNTNLTVDGAVYRGSLIANAPRGSASGTLANGGLCDSTGPWSGQIVLCERGVISFFEKAMNVQNSGGTATVIYNNTPGDFLGTLGDGNSTAIPVISLSQEDGQYLIASNKFGLPATVTSQIVKPASGYAAWNGTSMATPHVSAVAALLWSAKPTATNAEIRAAMTATARDFGAAGRDNAYGYGLVQAKAALEYLGGVTPPPPPPPPGDALPEITITSPQDGNVLPMCTDSQFTAAASDAEDGDLGASIVWTSNLDEEFGTGSSVFATLSGGTHTVTASVTDSGGQKSSDNITVHLLNQPPTLLLFSPSGDNPFPYGSTIVFDAWAMDPDQPNIGNSMLWTSNLIGQIGTGSNFSRTLPAGVHQITASVTDYCGKGSAATHTITVLPPPNTPPTVTITSPADGAVFPAGTSISFAGTVSDEDTGLSSSLVWEADGVQIGSGANFSAVLGEGTHTITASVTDSGGLPDEDTVTITVLPAVPALTVLVDTNQDVYGERDKVVISAHVTDGTNPVANANISVTIVTNSGSQRVYIGTTDSNGDYLINYKFNVRKDGYGQYSIQALATLSGYLDGHGSHTFEVQ